MYSDIFRFIMNTFIFFSTAVGFILRLFSFFLFSRCKNKPQLQLAVAIEDNINFIFTQ